MTNKRLGWYLEKENKIDNRKFDFRKQRSIIDAIPKILNGIALFFNIKEAYKKINRKKTFEYLENMKIQELIRKLISKRRIIVRVK